MQDLTYKKIYGSIIYCYVNAKFIILYMQGVMNMPQPVKLGKRERMTYAQIREVAEMPHLLQIQLDSYKWFVEECIREVF